MLVLWLWNRGIALLFFAVSMAVCFVASSESETKVGELRDDVVQPILESLASLKDGAEKVGQ